MPAQKSSKSNPAEAAAANSDPASSEAPEAPADSPPPQEDKSSLEDKERLVAEAYEQMLRAASRVSDAAGEATGSVREYARKHPGSALLVSFLVGAVLGALTSRR